IGSLGSDHTHEWFPAADLGAFLPSTPAFSLLGLRLGLYVASNPWTVTVSYISVGIGITGQPLVANKLYLNPLGVWVTVLNPLSSTAAPSLASWTIDGSLAVCSAARPGDFLHPDCVFDFGINPTSWSLYGQLENPNQTPVTTLIADLVGTGMNIGIPDTLTVEGFDFSASVDRGTGTMGPFTMNILISGGFAVGPFDLMGLSMNVSHMGDTSYALAASLKVGDILFRVSGTHAEHWIFTASAVGVLPIEHVVEQISSHFRANLTLPQPLLGLELHGLSLYFEKSSEGASEVRFTLDATLPVEEDRVVAIALAVSVESSGEPRQHHYKFAGSMTLGQTVFDLRFDQHSGTTQTGQNSDGSLLVARLTGESRLTMQDLLDALSADAPHAPFNLGVKGAFLLVHKTEGTARTLVGLQLGDIGLGGLPVVGGALAGTGLRDMALLYASAPFPDDEITKLAAEWGAEIVTLGTLAAAKADLARGIGFTASLDLPGHESTAFLLPRRASASTAVSQAPVVASNATAQTAPFTSAAGDTAVAQAAAPASTATWRDVNKSIGPVHIARVGAGYENGKVWLLLDAGLALGPIDLSLQGLGLGFDLHEFKAPDVTLAGLGVTLDGGGAVSIEGNFIELDGDYLGEAMVEMANLSLTAMGGYTPATKDTGPALLLFARLTEPLGGPPYAFITGVAAGFAVNRSLVLPTLDALPAFPLWPTSTSPGIPTADASAAQSPADRLATVARNLATIAPPMDGENWLAAGIDFKSFGMVESSALVTAAFGAKLEFALLGVSKVAIPKDAEHPVAFAQIAIEARCAPDTGVLTVDGKLTPASYVFMPDCHLTGGFAFYLWFAGEHAGDFVVTLGGYHPRFVPPVRPAHYPDVPRLGLNYRSGNLYIGGYNYFALTPNMLMAGMQMQATWDSGPISAWFDAGVDFLIAWKPFHYDARAYVHLGASFTLDFGLFSISITIHVGVDLSLWGPALGGRADIDLDVISFSVGFGADPEPPPLLTWDEFHHSLLPAPSPKPASGSKLRAMADSEPEQPPLCVISVASGVSSTPEDRQFAWVLDPDAFCIDARTTLPSKACAQLTKPQHTLDIGLLPMGNSADDFKSTLEVTLARCVPEQARDDEKNYSENVMLTDNYAAAVAAARASAGGKDDPILALSVSPILEATHPALYAKEKPADANAQMGAPLIANALMGVRLSPVTRRPAVSLAANVHAILFDQDRAPEQRRAEASPNVPVTHTSAAAPGATLEVSFTGGAPAVQCTGYRLSVLGADAPKAVVDARNDVLAALHAMGVLDSATASTAPDVQGLAKTALLDWPMLRALGEEVPEPA
ncbi:MAG: hypothetical protein JWM74_1349, partial [Myxococcaceae bacterium]|nr:hypothetical protein [Myxococcaceae bacterium]